MNDVLTALETRRIAMLPEHFRAMLATQVISYVSFFLSNDCVGNGKVADLLKAKEKLDALIGEAVQDKLADSGSARE